MLPLRLYLVTQCKTAKSLQYENNTTFISFDACGIIACFGSKGNKGYAEGKRQGATEDAQQE